MILSYGKFNESINNLLKPKNDDDILNNMIKNKLSDNDILMKSISNDYLYGVKYVLDKNINIISKLTISKLITEIDDIEILIYLLSKPEIKKYIGSLKIYILEKCKLNLHKDIIKPYEQYIIDIINSLSKFDISGTTYYYNDGDLFFIHSSNGDFITVVNSEIEKINKKYILLTTDYIILLIMYYSNNILNLKINNHLDQDELLYLIRNRDMIDN
ncbi:MAG: hypothetical protein WDA02_10705 [Saccharofermentanales bacterium]